MTSSVQRAWAKREEKQRRGPSGLREKENRRRKAGPVGVLAQK
jgi:hypothetical protein